MLTLVLYVVIIPDYLTMKIKPPGPTKGWKLPMEMNLWKNQKKKKKKKNQTPKPKTKSKEG